MIAQQRQALVIRWPLWAKRKEYLVPLFAVSSHLVKISDYRIAR